MRRCLIAGVLVFLSVISAGCVALGAGAVGGGAGGAVATSRGQSEDYSAGVKTAAVLSDVVYFPAKVIFATGGAATSGLAYLVTLGNREVTNDIWTASVGGDYLVTPAMIAGDDTVEFIGRPRG